MLHLQIRGENLETVRTHSALLLLSMLPTHDASLLRHVKESPCYSGWCYKQIDGELGDSSNNAMERGCMVRKPSDNKERCAYVMKSYKRVYICFCQGDQCNGVGFLSGRFWIIVIMLGLVRLL
eukprot:TRINITY_DN1867_c0_g1_i1.p1 TRINITY_DN1867_c0_g1~~TRINITY_DN1867_c0_g1_i1.p1  ORF type:complete len:123 (-),score=29.21 TRINITY_DN1867_c0_g1_i1:104-472(-)